ncbi:spore germination protein GerPB [Priestia taiwanensis]|uniref:Spore germination protein GerPB n=1 Tax=Priestia taiwanensis TaxID=1347902 RepID=A0A917ASS3_9BACI|nr:spore germination protein GerPB [Priestia taiwanensis]MBM7364214.1 spore germination protein PB [Priestia taiwanensis]GGE72584.1 putative spore germination protein GerPB [Priestia taiwanensis]
MNFYINQSIIINHLKVGGITNSSVFQIGSVGMIKALAEGRNTGNFTQAAPPLQAKGQSIKTSR